MEQMEVRGTKMETKTKERGVKTVRERSVRLDPPGMEVADKRAGFKSAADPTCVETG